MNDRLTNEQLRQAIRETWTDTQRCVGSDRDKAVEHLDTLRTVERNRATALIAAAVDGDQESPRKTCTWMIDRLGMLPGCAVAWYAPTLRFNFCPHCGGQIVKGRE